MSDSSTDKTYIELDALFKRADDVVATSVIGRPRRGSGYIPKVDAKIRLNAEVMAWLKDMGPRHYSRINGLLTALMEIDKAARSRADSASDAAAAGDVASATDAAAGSGSDAVSGVESGPASPSVPDSDTGSEPSAQADSVSQPGSVSSSATADFEQN